VKRAGAPWWRARLVPVATAGALACSACALVLGIEDPPLRQVDAGADTGPVDAGADCSPLPREGCRSCAVHDFCDDFDTPGEALFARWSSVLSSNPFRRGDSGITTDEAGLSPPGAIVTTAEGTSQSGYAIGLHALDLAASHPGRAAAGVKYVFYMSLEELALTEKAGPLPDASSAYVGAILRLLSIEGGQPKPAGAAVLVTDKGVYLAMSRDIISGGDQPNVAQLFEGDVKSLSANWVKAEILVAERDRAIAAGYTSCSTVAPGPVAAAMLSLPTFQGCVAVPPEFGDLGWTAQPTVGVGAGTFGSGTVRVRHDNVAVDFLE
jgi:hypothetical protein